MDQIIQADCLEELKKLPDKCVQTCATSPPYFGLRDYGVDGQIGLEETLEAYIQRIVEVFREVRRCLRDDGTLWLNLGDSYSAGGRGGGGKQDTNKGSINLGAWKVAGYRQKQLLGVPWKVAFALQADGWILRQDIIWHKPNPMPESVTDRCTKAHEYIFLLSKSLQYYFDNEAIKEPIKDASIIRAQAGVKFGGNNRCPDTRLQSGKEWHPSQVGEAMVLRDIAAIEKQMVLSMSLATAAPCGQ
jgi:DNA modification methylase